VPISVAIAYATPAFDFWLAAAPNLSLKNLDQLTIIPGYVGLVTLALAAVGLTRVRRLPLGLVLTTALGVALAGIIFGVPPFAWLARLPLVRYFQNFRYAQAFLAFSVALLAGAGLDGTGEPRGRRALAAVAAALALWVGWHVVVFRHQLLASGFIRLGAEFAGAGLIAAAVAAVAVHRLRPGLLTLPRLLAAAAGLELALYFALAGPVFGPMAQQFGKTPAVDFMNAAGGKPFRIYATDPRILHPNLAGLYGLDDLRDQTPLYLEDYVSLFATVDNLITPEEAMDHFLSGGKFFFELDLSQTPENLLDLLNVRYVLSRDQPGKPRAEILSTLEVLAPEPQFFQHVLDGSLGGVARSFYLLHAPGRMSFSGQDDFGNEMGGEAGLLDNAGVFLTAIAPSIAYPPVNRASLTYARFIRPGEAGRWFPFSKLHPGRKVFSSLPGPRNDNRCDYGAWSDPVWTTYLPFRRLNDDYGLSQAADYGLTQVYDREYRVYENTDVAPRVFAVSRLLPPVHTEQMISKLVLYDPRDAAFTDSTPIALSPAEITDIVEQPGRVTFRSRSDGPGFAVISNLYFPGWHAFIDGFETTVHRADAILQGVALPAGDRRVELIYDPMSYRPGFWQHAVSWAGIFGLMALALIRGRKVKGKR